MYAPRQFRSDKKKKPNKRFLSMLDHKQSGKTAAPPAFSVLDHGDDTKADQKQHDPVEENLHEPKGEAVQKKSVTSEAPSQLKMANGPAVQMKRFGDPVQMKTGEGGGKGGGSAQGGDVMGKMEAAFGADFSNVNIVQNSSKASDAGALAYAQGNEVHFAPGQYSPNTPGGQQLLGHELAHVVQQREGRVKATSEVGGMPVNDDHSLESEADSMGAKAAQFKMDASSSKSGGAVTGAPAAQMKLDPHSDQNAEKGDLTKDTANKNKDTDETSSELQDSQLALDGFGLEVSENEGENTSKEDAENEDGVQSKAEAESQESEDPESLAAESAASEGSTSDVPLGENVAPANENGEAAEKEGEENQSEEKAEGEKTENPEGKKEEGAGDQGGDAAKGEGGGDAAGGEGGGEGAGGEGGAVDAPAAEAPAAEGAAQVAGPEMAAPAFEPPVGDFGASDPTPPMALVPEEMAAGIAPEQIVMDAGDGYLVVKGMNAEEESGESESAAPIQMAPDPDDPPKKKKVQKVPANITESIFEKKRTAAKGLVDEFEKVNTAKIEVLRGLLPTIEPELEKSASAARGVVEAAVNTNREAITEDIRVKKEAAQTEATAAEGVVKGQYDAIVQKIKDKTVAEKARLQTAYDTNEKALTDLEKKAVESANKAYDDAAKGAREAGKKECEAIDRRIGTLMAGYSDPEEKVVEAMRAAALDTGKGFKEKVMEVANGAANEIPKGKAEFLRGIRDKIKEAREKTKAQFDGGVEGLRVAEEGAIKSADSTLQGQKDGIKSLLESTNKALDDQLTSQGQAVEDAGIKACDNIDATLKSSADGLKTQLEKAISDIEAQIKDTVSKVTNTKNPDEVAIKKLLDDVSRQIDSSVKDSESNIKTGITDSGNGITEQGTNAETGLAEIATKSAEDSQLAVEGLVTSYTDLQGKSQEAFNGVYTKYEGDAKKAVDDAVKEIEGVVKDTGEGFKKAEEGLKQTFDKKVEELNRDIKKVTADLDAQVKKNVDEAAEKAREPWWKKALKILVAVVIAIAVTALIVAFCPFTLGGVLLAFAIGAVGAVIKLGIENLIDGKLSSWQEYLAEFVGGGIGGIFTLLGGQLAGKLAGGVVAKLSGWSAKFASSAALQAITKFSVDVLVGTVLDTLGSGFIQLGKNLCLGKEVSFKVFVETMKKEVLTNFLGNFGGTLIGNWIGKTAVGKKIASFFGKNAVGEGVEAEAKAIAEAEAKALAEAEAKALAEKEAKELAEKEAKELAEKQAKEAAEAEAKELAEKQAKELAEKQAKELAEKEARELAEKQAKELAEKEAKELAEKEAKELAEKEAKELAEKEAAEAAKKAKKTGAELADELGWPKAPEGYHWTRNGDSPIPSLQRNPGKADVLPPAKYDPALKKFVPEVDAPKGYNWQWRDGKLVLARNPGMKSKLPELQYDPTSPSQFKNLETGKPYVSHLEVKDAILDKIKDTPGFQLKLTDDELKALIDKAQAMGFGRADIDALMGIAARKHWVSASELEKVMAMVAEKAKTSTIPFKDGWDFMRAWREGQERLVSGSHLDPSEYLDPKYVAEHLKKFEGQASYLVGSDPYEKFVMPNSKLGRDDGLFISTKDAIDKALAEAKGDLRKIELLLGLPNGCLGNKGLWRIDVPNPETSGLRLPNGKETGANEYWIPGGFTSGGPAEAVIDQIPKSDATINEVIKK